MEAQVAAGVAFERLVRESPPELRDYCKYSAGYAHKHRAVIEQFARFAHRNAMLKRESTHEKQAWLEAHQNYFF